MHIPDIEIHTAIGEIYITPNGAMEIYSEHGLVIAACTIVLALLVFGFCLGRISKRA